MCERGRGETHGLTNQRMKWRRNRHSHSWFAARTGAKRAGSRRCLSREFGKIRALAKGGRRLKSSFEVAFDLLTVCRIMFIRSLHGGLDLLTEARLEEQFAILRHSLPALYAGYYIAELLADGTQDYDPHPPLFDAAVTTLRSLGPRKAKADLTPPAPFPTKEGGAGAEHNPPTTFPTRQGEESPSPPTSPAHSPGKSGDPGGMATGRPATLHPDAAAAISAFELVWLRRLGYSPRLDACAVCGVELVELDGPRLFSPSVGGILCPRCGPTVLDRHGLSPRALHCLRALAVPGATPELPADAAREVRQTLGQTVSCVLGRRPRLLWYVDGR